MMIRLFDLLTDNVEKNRVTWAHVLIIVVLVLVLLILIVLALDIPVVDCCCSLLKHFVQLSPHTSLLMLFLLWFCCCS